MQLSKNATGNLINRYKAVLKKCNLLNTFGSLAMATMLCLGLAGGLTLELGNPQGALAATVTDVKSDGTATNANGGDHTVSTDQSGNDAYGGQANTSNSTSGGDSASATANNNTLDITNTGTITNAYGGSAFSGGGDVTLGNGHGGDGSTATASNNNMTIAVGGTVNNDAYGGYAWSLGGVVDSGSGGDGGNANAAMANENEIGISGTVDWSAYGGYAKSEGGDVTLGNGHGGDGSTATASNNNMTIAVGGTVNNDAYGGYAWSLGGVVDSGSGGDGGVAIANENEITIYGTVKNYTYGGYAWNLANDGGTAGTATASYNIVTVETGSTINRDTYGGYAKSNGGDVDSGTGGDAGAVTTNENGITIRGTVDWSAYGGQAQSNGGNSDSGTGGTAGVATANNNSVTVETSGTVKQGIYAGYALSFGGGSDSGTGGDASTATANENKITIYGTVGFSVLGSYATSEGGTNDNDIAGNAATATASFNTVLIEGATIGTVGNDKVGHIIGGVAIGNADSRAENNTVTLSGAVTFLNANNFVTGGLTQNQFKGFLVSPHTFNGNTLNVERYAGNKIGTLGNFETYNFIVGDTVKNSDTLLEVGTLHLSNGASGANEKFASIGSVSIAPNSLLTEKDYIILVDYDTANGTLGNNNGSVTAQQGTFLDMTAWVSQDTSLGAIVATFSPPKTNALAGGIMGANAAGMGQVILNMEHTTDGATSSAQDAIDITLGKEKSINAGSEILGEQKAFTTFATISGGTMSYDVGDGLDVQSLSFVSGLTYGYKHKGGNLLLAAFFEGSTGSFDTHNTEVDGSSIHGDGNSDTYGFGLLARYDFYTDFGTPYFEGSFHYGQVRSQYQSDDIVDPVTRETASFENTNDYTAFHLGIGYIWDITKNSKLDLYANYYYIHQGADNFTILDSNFAMDSINSQRLRFGAEYSYYATLQDNSLLELSLGLAYEYEFDGHMRGTVLDVAIKEESLQGSTYIGELSAKYSPNSVEGLSFSLGVQGYLGEREGIVGSVGVQYSF